MNPEDFKFQKLWISESVGLTFHGFDFVVGAFKGAGGYGVVIPGEDTLGVEAERFGKIFQYTNSGGFGIRNPIHEQGFGRFAVVLFPYYVKFFLEIIGRGQWFVETQRFPQTLGFAA